MNPYQQQIPGMGFPGGAPGLPPGMGMPGMPGMPQFNPAMQQHGTMPGMPPGMPFNSAFPGGSAGGLLPACFESLRSTLFLKTKCLGAPQQPDQVAAASSAHAVALAAQAATAAAVAARIHMQQAQLATGTDEEELDENGEPDKTPKIPCHGNQENFNINIMLYQNILNSEYIRDL